ncbi:MAG: cobalamin-dependent protein [Anaerolineae bacterium]|nr:cobalamin-dependent protein [Anaerolineae bacterium]
MAKLLLCHPVFLSLSPEEQASASPYFPLGLLYLASYVRDNGHEVAIFDGTFEADETSFARRLAAEQPDAVGIAALLPNRDIALRLAATARDAGVPVIFGGPDATKYPWRYLAFPQVDVVVHHEGELTITRLLDLLDAGQFNRETFVQELGIAYRDECGDPVVNPPRPNIENLDELPMPARDLIDMDRYLDTWRETNGYSSLTVSTARGCPYGCEWCKDAVYGTSYRQRSPESVAREMKMLKETYQIDRLRIVDDVDGIDREWFDNWAEAAEQMDAVIPFEALEELERQDLPLLDVRSCL